MGHEFTAIMKVKVKNFSSDGMLIYSRLGGQLYLTIIPRARMGLRPHGLLTQRR